MYRRERPVLLLAITASYAALAAVAILLTRLGGGVALLWLANAPLLAVLTTRRPRHWRGPALAATLGGTLAAMITLPAPHFPMLFSALNVAETMFAVTLLRRWRVADSPFGNGRAVALFVVAAGLLAPMFSGTVAAMLVRPHLGQSFGTIWLDWVIGRGLGNLIGTPVALMFVDPRRIFDKLANRAAIGEAAAVTAMVVATTCLVFSIDSIPLLFVVSVPVLVATIRFQRLGAAASVAIVAAIGGGMTLAGHGPIMLVHGEAGTRLQVFQLFLGAQFVLALPVAAVLSERSTLLRALVESEARYRLLADNATDAILSLDPDGTIRFASAATFELGLFTPESLVGRNALRLVIEEDRDRVRAAHASTLRHPDRHFSVEYRIRKADGTISWFESNMRAVLGDLGEIAAAVSVVREIGTRKAREAELERQATTDPLTGLLNRAAIRERLDRAAKDQAERTSIAIFDLDHFKRINDRNGHATGDAVLLAFADLLHDKLRPCDSIGRIGGEEFMVLLDDLTPDQAVAACERLRHAVAEAPLAMGVDGPIFVTVSIGLSPLSSDAGQAVRAADTALYAAKAAGRDRIKLAV